MTSNPFDGVVDAAIRLYGAHCHALKHTPTWYSLAPYRRAPWLAVAREAWHMVDEARAPRPSKGELLNRALLSEEGDPEAAAHTYEEECKRYGY